MNRVVFFLVIFVLVAVPIHAETVVRGRVFDDKGKKTVEFANVGVTGRTANWSEPVRVTVTETMRSRFIKMVTTK